MEELLPWLYRRGITTGGFSHEALATLLGGGAFGLSASIISRLKAKWLDKHHAWAQRNLSDTRYAYLWADGIYSNARQVIAFVCWLSSGLRYMVVKSCFLFEDGYREYEVSAYELLDSLHSGSLQASPNLATGENAMGFWNALEEVFRIPGTTVSGA